MRVRARRRTGQNCRSIPADRLDRAAAMAAMPALIKAYLRLGGFVGDGAWVDHAFNTTDVCLVMDTGRMSARHRDFYTRRRARLRMTTGIPPEPRLAPGFAPSAGCAGCAKGLTLGLVTYAGLAGAAGPAVRGPAFRPRRPLTPHVTQFVCRAALRILGLRLTVSGTPMAERGAVVANHSSWLDIFTLNAIQRVYFVAKSEVSGWPGIGWLARATGTVFITRRGVEAKAQQEIFEARLRAGHKLLFFPEGTSTDTIRVLPFKSSLFQAFYTHGLDRLMFIQPVTVIYRAPEGPGPALLRLVG